MNGPKRILFYCLLLLCLAACSNNKLLLALQTDQQLNLNQVGQPLPVVVRIYQLNDQQAFMHATFSELWRNDYQVLGAALLTRKDFNLNPDSQKKLKITLKKGTKFVALMAVFRKPKRYRWRIIKPVGSKLSLLPHTLKIKLNRSTIEFIE